MKISMTFVLVVSVLLSQFNVRQIFAGTKTISSLADWMGVSSFYLDPAGDGGGKGQATDITGLGIINDGTKLFARWDVILGNSSKLSGDYVVAFAPRGSYLNANTNLKIDVNLKNGIVDVIYVYYLDTSGKESTSTLDTSYAQVTYDNGNKNPGAVVHVLLAVPFTALQDLTGIAESAKLYNNSLRYIWGGTPAGNCNLTSALKDVLPNGGGTAKNVLDYDAGAGSSTPIMTTEPLISMDAVADDPIAVPRLTGPLQKSYTG
jgi:hypothetical protein